MADELRAHVAHRADDLEAAGFSRPDAERQARLELGAVESHKEAIRDERSLGRTRRVLEQTVSDVRLGWRRLLRAPLFALFAIGSIGLGAGITTTVFALVQEAFWPSSGIHRPTEVLLVATQLPRTPQWDRAMSTADFEDYRAGQTSFDGLAGASKFSQSLSLDEGTQLVSAEAVTDRYFETIGVAASRGRTLQQADARADAPSVMVLSHHLWRRLFASDPEVVGRVVRFGGASFEIIGVADPGYRGLNARTPRTTDLWIPLHTTSRLPVYGTATGPLAARTSLSLTVAGRLKPGVPFARAGTEAATISAALDATHPQTTAAWDGTASRQVPAERRWILRPVEETSHAGIGPEVILSIVALVLLVACTNLANLSLARGTARQSELAVRLALGASRGRLIRELSAESVMVGAGGFALALLISQLLLTATTLDLPIFNDQAGAYDPRLNPMNVAATAVAVGLALLVFGLWPAFRLTSGADVRSTLSTAGTAASPSWRTERLLIRVQVAVSVLLFCGAAGFIGALVGQARQDPGIDLDHLTVARTSLRLQMWDEDRSRQAIDAVTAVAPGRFGFQSVAFSSSMPFGGHVDTYASVGLTPPDGSGGGGTMLLASTPGIFDALGVDVVAGRAFDRRDVQGTDPVAVLSESAARTFFGSTDVVGREIFVRGQLNALDRTIVETRRVIGVARDTDVGSLGKRGQGLLYVPLAQRYEPPNFVVARRAAEDTGDLRGLISTGDPDVAVDAVGSGLVMLGGGWNAARVLAGVALTLGSITLILTMAGLFGVLSALVLRRSREIGIRKALGADNATIRRMVLRDGARPVAGGTAIGLFLGLLAGFLIRAALPVEAPPFSVVALALVIATVVPATLAACELPARQAMRVDPNVTLKDG
jgi:predicted permease